MSQALVYSRPPMWRRVMDRMAYAYNCRFRKQHYVYEFDPTSAAADGMADVEVERFDRVDDVDGSVWDALASEGGIVSCENDRAEIRARGSLWVARLEGNVVG